MDKKQALGILKQAINYNNDGSCGKGNWMLGTDGIESVKVAIESLESLEKDMMKNREEIVC